MLDDDLGRRMKDAALRPAGGLNMRSVQGRARTLRWIRRGMAVTIHPCTHRSGGRDRNAVAARTSHACCNEPLWSSADFLAPPLGGQKDQPQAPIDSSSGDRHRSSRAGGRARRECV